MKHKFKIGTKNILFDSDISGVYVFDSVEADIYNYVSGANALPESCPMDLRYSLAKYDSQVLEAAYKNVRCVLFCGEGYKKIEFDSDIAFDGEVKRCEGNGFYDKVLALADSGAGVIDHEADFCDTDTACREYEKLAREIYKRNVMGKGFVFLPFVLKKGDIERIKDADPCEQKRIECAIYLKAVL